VLRALCRAKIHRITVTESRLDYEGSVTVDAALLQAAGILPFEIVQITNLSNGALWRTYAMAGASGSGVFCLNGPPARLFHPGDLAIVLAHSYCAEGEIPGWSQRTVFVDERNRLLRTEEQCLPQS
jgi:aspartate 1-decarboxylase